MKENQHEVKIKVKYQIGDEVYLISDPDQFKRMVLGYVIMPGFIKYIVCLSDQETNHYEIELSSEKSHEYVFQN